jgi:anti-sigma regulatory factor (Ser/Thr protein kinase)/ferredoxin
MITESYRIIGGDFEQAGSASSRLKEHLKKLGVEPKEMRRVMIVAYEAEMNVVIHARNGDMLVTLDNSQIAIEVKDEGPGIPDIDQAMKEGFSTAPSVARELGFGAGMGLPNIKKNSDLFAIESVVGQGTSVRSTIYLKLYEIHGAMHNSLHVNAERCCECLDCLKICPTKAMRVRYGRPQILRHLCIDCTACIAVCKTGALTVEGADNVLSSPEDKLLIAPPSFLVQFGVDVSPERVLEALRELGFKEIRTTEGWEIVLHEAVIEYAKEEATVKPVISPVCPAIVNLIEMRFPSLIGNLAPYLSPVEAAQNDLKDQQAVMVVACPSQHTALNREGAPPNVKRMIPSNLVKVVLPLVMMNPEQRHEPDWQCSLKSQDSQEVLCVSGISHVMNVLELELFACDQGCFGSPFLREDPFVARHLWLHAHIERGISAKAVRRKHPFRPREGLRLDADMASAIMKLSKIEALSRILPGKNCGKCGAPTCDSLAEDIVMGRATRDACVYLKE